MGIARAQGNVGEAMNTAIYAYGVQPLYGSPNEKHFYELFDGTILLWKPHSFLHYWIDDRLVYHDCIKETGDIPQCLWVTHSKFKVELHGPNNYTIKSA